MRLILRTISYLLREIKAKYFKISKYKSWEPSKPPSPPIAIIQHILGYVYYRYKKTQELFRVWIFNRKLDIEQNEIFVEMVRYSSKLLIYLGLLLLVTLFLDWIRIRLYSFNEPFVFAIPSPSVHLAEIVLGAIVAAISGILGLVFALYSVGFQLSTAKYSHKVTDYLNAEKVGSYYFKLLIFTDLYTLIVLFVVLLTNSVALVSFIISFILFSMSLMGIIVFKNHYLLSIKPLSIYYRLYSEIFNTFTNINYFDKPDVKNFRLTKNKRIKSFKLYIHFRNSWSVVKTSQKETRRLLDIGQALFRDTLRNGAVDDFNSGLLFSANVLRKYLCIKRYIDEDHSWWFPERYEYIKASDNLMYPIKANYEIKGTGPLYIQKPNNQWLEEYIISVLTEAQEELKTNKNKKLALGLINAYKLILAGDYTRDSEGHFNKTDLGAFENQEFSICDNSLSKFFELYDLIKDDNLLFEEYLNSLFQVSQVAIDFYPSENLKKSISLLVDKEGKLSTPLTEINSLDLPKIARNSISDYWKLLNIEQVAEGKIITPLKWIEDSIIENYEKQLDIESEKYLEKIISHTEKIMVDLYARKEFKKLAQIVKIRYEFVSRLMFLRKYSTAEKLTRLIKTNIVYIAYLPSEIIDEFEIREQIEKGLFPGLVERKKTIYKYYLESLFITLTHLLNIHKENINLFMALMRIPIMIGSLAYIISELDQDNYYIFEFMRLAEKFVSKGAIDEVFEVAEGVKNDITIGERFALIEGEANRYRLYYRQVINSVQDLPEDWEDSGGLAIGLTKTVRHPSRLIRKIGAFEFYDMYEANEDFVEWVKKREVIKKLVFVILNKK